MIRNPRTLSAIRFPVIAAVLIGVLRAFPAYAAVKVGLGAGLLASALASFGVLALVWIVIRRREYSVLSSAGQLWAALLLSWTLSGILTHPIANEIAPDVTWGVRVLFDVPGTMNHPAT